jgi:glutathione S-transferase
MKLYLNRTSPYARLVMVVAHEKGLADAIECVWTDPWTSPPELLAVNPLAKVPALVTDDGQSIVESACICDLLDAWGDGRRLLPSILPARVSTLRKHGLGRGLIDVAFGVTMDRRFGAPGHASELARRWMDAVGAAIAAIERAAPLTPVDMPPDLGDLAIAVGVAYTEFRLPEIRWRDSAPRVAGWYNQIAARASMVLTAQT